MKRNLSIAAAIVLVSAALATGLYQQSSLLQMVSRLGLDTSNNVGGYNLNSRGQPFFLFDTGDGTVGRWERHVEDLYGEQPGGIWINGVGYEFGYADSARVITGEPWTWPGMETYALQDEVRAWITPPLTINVAARDSLWHMGGNLWLMFDDCTTDSVTAVKSRPAPNYPVQSVYRYQVTYAHPDSVDALPVFDSNVNTWQHSTIVLTPNDYNIWFAMIDGFGMQGHWIGPVRMISGSCP